MGKDKIEPYPEGIFTLVEVFELGFDRWPVKDEQAKEARKVFEEDRDFAFLMRESGGVVSGMAEKRLQWIIARIKVRYKVKHKVKNYLDS